MAEGPDGRAFDVVTGGLGTNSPEFREVARFVASGDTLSGFLRDLKARYSEMQGVTPDAAAAPAGDAPKASKANAEPTGSLLPRRRGAFRRAEIPASAFCVLLFEARLHGHRLQIDAVLRE